MVEEDNDQATWGSTKAIKVIREAVAESMPQQQQDITETKLPIKVVIALVGFAVGQCLAVAGVYYDLLEQVHALQEESGTVSQLEVAELRLKLAQLERDAQRIEQSMMESPTVLDNMRRVGELNADVRELKARVDALERRP